MNLSQPDASQFVQVFHKCLEEKVLQDDALAPFIEAIRSVAAAPVGIDLDEIDHPLLDHLDDAIANARGGAELISAVTKLAMDKRWKQVYSGEGINGEMADFMLSKKIVSPKGLLIDDSVRLGFFLLAPYFEYIMHEHAALEIYYVHSGSITIQNGTESKPVRLTPGQYSVTPSGMPHALQTGDSPVLLLYMWTGNVMAPIWWRVKDDDGVWTKVLAKNP